VVVLPGQVTQLLLDTQPAMAVMVGSFMGGTCACAGTLGTRQAP
jgi:hypothetical protein